MVPRWHGGFPCATTRGTLFPLPEMRMTTEAVVAENLRQEFGSRVALDDVSLRVGSGEIFGLLGPNGGGKTTLFRILATLLRPTAGTARVFGSDLTEAAAVRSHLGVVFQNPGLDLHLTVRENLDCHGQIFGLSARELGQRRQELLTRLGLAERADDRAGTLSGGLQRRAELAKVLLHRPRLLLLDEPSTGLDPGARRDFLRYLDELRRAEGTTVLLTTHYMEEAERCDRIALLDGGRLVASGAPSELKARVGGDVVVVQTEDPAALQESVRRRLGVEAQVVNGSLRIEHPRGHELVRDLVEAFRTEVGLVTYGRPTLEDVFIQLTGHRFWADSAAGEA